MLNPNSIWPSNGIIGSEQIQIPDGVNEKWPEGDVLVGNFVYKNGKLVGFVDCKSLVINDSKTTTFPYDFVKITLSDELEKSLTIIKGERNKYLDVKYEDMGDNFILPEGYQRVEYLENIIPNSQFIDTNLTATEKTSVYLDIYQYQQIDRWGCIFGVRNSGDYSGLGGITIWTYNYNDRPENGGILNIYYTSVNRNSESLLIHPYLQNLKVHYEITPTKLVANEYSKIVEKHEPFTSVGSMILFGRREVEIVPVNCTQAKVYSLTIKEDNKTVLNFIPCLNETGTPCMYDTITGKPFYNVGSGQFSYPAPSPTMTTDLENKLYGKMTEHGIQKLYKTPDNYSGTIEDYVSEYGFKEIVEPPKPEEGYWTPEWTETDTQLILQWIETEPPTII